MQFKTTNIGGIPTACVGRRELAQLLATRCVAYRRDPSLEPFLVFSNNGHAVSIANQEPAYMAQMNQADLVHADGQSIVTFSKWVDGPRIPERSATTDMIHDLPTMADQPLKHFLLGGTERVVTKAAQLLAEKYPLFTVAGTQHGYFSDADEDALCAQINASGADVLWVGLGKPKEQDFCLRNKSRLKVGVIITCGGCYNYITGDYPRAPEWMQRLGLEWLHRMATNPAKLFVRYLTTNPHAIFCVLTQRKARNES